MVDSEIWTKITEICRDVFDDENLIVDRESSASTITAWDSLSHLNLISDIEDAFDVQFALEEFTSAKNLGELVDCLVRKLES